MFTVDVKQQYNLSDTVKIGKVEITRVNGNKFGFHKIKLTIQNLFNRLRYKLTEMVSNNITQLNFPHLSNTNITRIPWNTVSWQSAYCYHLLNQKTWRKFTPPQCQHWWFQSCQKSNTYVTHFANDRWDKNYTYILQMLGVEWCLYVWKYRRTWMAQTGLGSWNLLQSKVVPASQAKFLCLQTELYGL